MHVLMFALGSAGDVHPVLGLAAALQARGHRITVATNPYFQSLVEQIGVAFVPVGTAEELREVIADPRLWDPLKAFDFIADRMMIRYLPDIYNVVAAHAVKGETVMIAPPTALGVRIARDKLGIPLATMHLAPSPIRSIYEGPVLPPLKLGAGVPQLFKRLQLWLSDKLILDRKLAPPVNAKLAELGLPAVRGITDQWWHSPDLALCLFPAWFAAPQPDWPPQCVLTGFPLWDEATVAEPSPRVEVFLQAGPPPIVFTPGSANVHGHEFFAAAAAACERLNRRGMLLTRHGEQIPASLPPGVEHFDFVPFSQLLPRAAAVVHHAGVGSAAQGLAAGTPQVAMPMAHDQYDNAARLERLGVGVSVPQKSFNAATLTAALEKILYTPTVRERAKHYAAKIDTPAALEKSCVAIESLLTKATG